MTSVNPSTESSAVPWTDMRYGVGMQYRVNAKAKSACTVGVVGELVAIDFSTGHHDLRFHDGTMISYAPEAVDFVGCNAAGCTGHA